MPMKPKTKPNIVNWVQISVDRLDSTIKRITKANGLNLTKVGNQKQYKLVSQADEIVARIYHHARSSQVLIAKTFQGYITRDLHVKLNGKPLEHTGHSITGDL